MIDDWFSVIELPLTIEQFHRLPRNPAYKYEYFDGQARLTPRPTSCFAVLDLEIVPQFASGVAARDKIEIRRLQDADWSYLPSLFAAAFQRVEPFASLDDDARIRAAEDCLGRTRAAGEGPLVEEACLVANHEDRLAGAILITLPPPYKFETTSGLPHVTWIFVSPFEIRRGIGTALLRAAVQALSQLGYARLASGFLVGNESSMLWHWQAGFRLPEQPWSLRAALRRSIPAATEQA